MSSKFQPSYCCAIPSVRGLKFIKIQLFLEDPPKNWTCQLSEESTRRSGILPVHSFVAPVHLHLSSQKRGHRHHSILGNAQHVILTWSEWSVYDKDHIHCIHIYNVILTRRNVSVTSVGSTYFVKYSDCTRIVDNIFSSPAEFRSQSLWYCRAADNLLCCKIDGIWFSTRQVYLVAELPMSTYCVCCPWLLKESVTSRDN